MTFRKYLLIGKIFTHLKKLQHLGSSCQGQTLLKHSLRSRLRNVMPRRYGISCYIESTSGAKHFVSADPIDDYVVEEVLGELSHLYFPSLSTQIQHRLLDGGWILDVGAYNGYWSAEMLVRYPKAHAILVEPNPVKHENLIKTLSASTVLSRARVIQAGLAEERQQAWLIKSSEGPWGDWVETSAGVAQCAVPVETMRLNDITGGKRITLIKCNAEGAEFSLVRQLFAMDAHPLFMIMMVHPEHGDVKKLWKTLRQRYTVTVVLDHPSRPCWHAVLK